MSDDKETPEERKRRIVTKMLQRESWRNIERQFQERYGDEKKRSAPTEQEE